MKKGIHCFQLPEMMDSRLRKNDAEVPSEFIVEKRGNAKDQSTQPLLREIPNFLHFSYNVALEILRYFAVLTILP